MDWRRICIYTCVRCGHDASLTTFRSGLADRITIRPQCISSVFTPVLSCGHEQSDRITHMLMPGVKGVTEFNFNYILREPLIQQLRGELREK